MQVCQRCRRKRHDGSSYLVKTSSRDCGEETSDGIGGRIGAVHAETSSTSRPSSIAPTAVCRGRKSAVTTVNRRRSCLSFAWLVIRHGTVYGFAVLGVLLSPIPVLMLGDHDVQNSLRSPEKHSGVYSIQDWKPEVAFVPPPDSGDFDGDGTADLLTVEYYHQEPLFSPSTSGMLYVRSGRTKEVLLAHAVPTPLMGGQWTSDVDGNGTTDVLIWSLRSHAVLGMRRARRVSSRD